MKKLKYVIAITTGVLFDLLFWEKMYGFSFALFISVFSVAVLIIEKIRIRDLPRLSLIPYFLAILFALLTFIRLELFTTFLNMSVSALMLTIAVLTLKSGRWPQLGFTEYLRYGFHLIQQVAAFPIGSRNENSPGERQQKRKTFISVLRGLFFAIPAVIIFTFLLSEADLIFSDTVNVFIEWINLGEDQRNSRSDFLDPIYGQPPPICSRFRKKEKRRQCASTRRKAADQTISRAC